MLFSNSPPQSERELLKRANSLIGCTLGELATALKQNLNPNSSRSKGSLGQLLEIALGATSGSLAQPDFNDLGIELKTLPLSEKGIPKESTYVCTAPIPHSDRHWRQSRVYKKMAHVLWIPYLDAHPIEDRKICTPLLWQMPTDIEAVLKQDWEELTEAIHLGCIENLSAHLGTYLQIRPKAANSHTLIQVMNESGTLISIVPRGFYLRSIVTKLILENQYFTP